MKTVVVALALVGLTAGCGDPILPDHTAFVEIEMIDTGTAQQSAGDSHELCFDTQNRETVLVYPLGMSGTGEPRTLNAVAQFRIAPFPGLNLQPGQAVAFHVQGSSLSFAIEGVREDGTRFFEFLSGLDILLERGGGGVITGVHRTVLLQVVTGAERIEENTSFSLIFSLNPTGETFYEIGRERYGIRNCPLPDTEDDGNLGFIPPQVLEPASLVAVTEKDPQGACHVLEPDSDAVQQQLAQANETTRFLNGVSGVAVGLLARTRDRSRGLVVTAHPPLVAGDADPPPGTSPFILRKDIFRLDLTNGDVFRLTRHREEGRSVGSANWSPAGDRIAYRLTDFTDPTFPTELRVLDVATRASTRLADVATGFVSWSNDGNTIIYSADGHIRAVDPDGANERLLFAKTDVAPNIDRLQSATWHPTENKIVCVGKATGNLTGGPVYVLDLDTQEVTQVTDGMNDGLLPAETAEDHDTVWSPDGTKVAFVRRTSSSQSDKLMVLDLVNGGPPVAIPGTLPYRNLDW